jgi:hypothetical protein
MADIDADYRQWTITIGAPTTISTTLADIPLDTCLKTIVKNDLELHELGHDFSNLLRTKVETPDKHVHLHTHLDLKEPLQHFNNCSTFDSSTEIIIVADTGASDGLTFDPDDFVEITYGNFGSMTTAASDAKFPLIASGIVEYEAISENGELYFWRYPANLCKEAGTRLCSPQANSAYLKLDQRHSQFEGNHAYFSMTVNAEGNRITVPIDRQTNLPLIRARTTKKSRPVQERQRSPSCPCAANQWCRCTVSDETKHPFRHEYDQMLAYGSKVLVDSNINLTGPQKVLKFDHD